VAAAIQDLCRAQPGAIEQRVVGLHLGQCFRWCGQLNAGRLQRIGMAGDARR
jgi:hypothetical protein